MQLEIRQIEKKDREAFIRLSLELTKYNKRQHDKFIADFDQVLKVREQRVAARFDKLGGSPHIVIFIAFMGHVPVGYIRAFTYDNKFHYGCLDELYVSEDARGQGVGTKLVDAVTSWMTERQVIRIIISVYSWNTATRKFYQDAGFEEYAVSYEKSVQTQD